MLKNSSVKKSFFLLCCGRSWPACTESNATALEWTGRLSSEALSQTPLKFSLTCLWLKASESPRQVESLEPARWRLSQQINTHDLKWDAQQSNVCGNAQASAYFGPSVCLCRCGGGSCLTECGPVTFLLLVNMNHILFPNILILSIGFLPCWRLNTISGRCCTN